MLFREFRVISSYSQIYKYFYPRNKISTSYTLKNAKCNKLAEHFKMIQRISLIQTRWFEIWPWSMQKLKVQVIGEVLWNWCQKLTFQIQKNYSRSLFLLTNITFHYLLSFYTRCLKLKVHRAVFWTQSTMKRFRENGYLSKAVIYFRKKFHHRCFIAGLTLRKSLHNASSLYAEEENWLILGINFPKWLLYV